MRIAFSESVSTVSEHVGAYTDPLSDQALGGACFAPGTWCGYKKLTKTEEYLDRCLTRFYEAFQ